METSVVRLGAWCDLETEDEARARLLAGAPKDEGGPWSAGPANDDPDADAADAADAADGAGPRPARYVPQPGVPVLSPGSLALRVEEFAVLADGRRLRLHAERGFGLSAGADPWQLLTRESLESAVRATVLPDDAEETGDDHPWEWLSELLRGHGVEATADGLRTLPYVVELSDRLLSRLAPRA